MDDGAKALRWAGRVPRSWIRRLYEADAQGLADQELLDAVGAALCARVESILVVTRAHSGQAQCPLCNTLIPHGWNKAESLVCPGCNWHTTWGAYLKSYQDKQLHGGGAIEAFERFLRDFERARSPDAKMRAIDTLIHAFHCELLEHPSRSAAINVIGGTQADVLELLDTLAYGDQSTAGLNETRRAFDAMWRRSLVAHLRPQGPPDSKDDV